MGTSKHQLYPVERRPYLSHALLLQSEKKQHTLDEEARRAQGEAAASKIASHSAQLIRKLKIKRYKQIFEFLDQNHEGSVDLAALMESAPQWLDDLDDEVCCGECW